MTDASPAVALLFDDTELGGHLRDALQERGARIVHEGEVSGLTPELLQQVGADVVVVNLDDAADDALDRLYEAVDGDRPRVVFNDAQASRSLVGWERARWARHLAAKVLATGDLDPPRPDNAREIQLPPVGAEPGSPSSPAASLLLNEPVAPVATVPEPLGITSMVEELPMADDRPIAAGIDPPDDTPVQASGAPTAETDPGFALETDFGSDLDLDADIDFPILDRIAFDAIALEHTDVPVSASLAAESEDLAAELEALLASGDLAAEEEEVVGTGLRFVDDVEPLPLYDGTFGASEPSELDLAHAGAGSTGVRMPAVATATFDIEHLQLTALTEPEPSVRREVAADALLAPTAVSAPEGWALLDDDALPEPSNFGVEKLSAAEFLAPDVEAASVQIEPTMNLELVSLEDAIAPQAFVQDHEMLLDELGSALSKIVLLGASVDGTEAVCKFLDALPQGTRLTFLLTHHLGGQTDAQMLERLAGHGPLPVRLADAGRPAQMGEVLVVPSGQQVRVFRDGSMELAATDAPEPSIDASLSTVANAFGRDALAIVFSGRGTDGTAGAQAIHDRGGQVWVESPSGDHFADMVSGIFAERLVSFSGSPQQLAAHLIEVFP